MPFLTTIPNHFDLPRRLQRLGELAYNLWWTWNPPAQRLFSRIDNALWERLNHNPLRFLRQVGRAGINAAAQNAYYLDLYDRVCAEFDQYLTGTDTWCARYHPEALHQTIAYFSMEFGLHETLPIYSGGLGVLAGDHLKEASDLGLPLVGVGLLYGEGYFTQRIAENGWQEAINNPLNFEELPLLLVRGQDERPVLVSVDFPNRSVWAQIWELRVGRVPLYLLDTNMEANQPADRQLTTRLYWNDPDLRIAQEILLGIGGVRALRLLGLNPAVWHMNEGHAAFLTLERIRERVAAGQSFESALRETPPNNVFTTHTPVPAGNDEFPFDLIEKYLPPLWQSLKLTKDQFLDLGRQRHDGHETFSMPALALRLSAGRNAVSELHGRVARCMWRHLWPERQDEEEIPITHITNGVHAASWLARRMRVLLEKYLGEDWLEHIDDPHVWEKVNQIPDRELWAVRQHLKRKLVFYVQERARLRWMQGAVHPVQVVAAGAMLDPYALTIGFARRFATYKRAALVLSDMERLLRILNQPNRPVQIIFAGKAHPADEPGKLLLQQVYQAVKKAENGGRLVFLEDYDINLAHYLVQGVDVWLNTPLRPNEASGTSGMKAALNGVLNFSVLDGWWREAYNGQNGWAIGQDADPLGDADQIDAASLYDTLENEIVPLYYGDRNGDDVPSKWLGRVKESLRTIAPQFNTRRMLKEYIEQLYRPACHPSQVASQE